MNPAILSVLLAVCSTQFGAGIAKGLLGEIGPFGTVALRIGFAAAMLWIFARPQWKGQSKMTYLHVALFSVALTGMNVCFYIALKHIPLGIAVTVEFVGPLGVALVHSRRRVDVFWACIATVGILLFAPWTGAQYSTFGLLFALLSGVGWAAYIVTSANVGRVIPGLGGLTLAMTIGACVVVPIGLVTSGGTLLTAHSLLLGIVIAGLSSALPYGLELAALRRIHKRVFGLLMSTEPAIAALFGFVLLGEVINWRTWLGILLVTSATIASRNTPLEETHVN